MTLYIYKKADDSTRTNSTNSADSASRSEGEIKSEQYTAPNTPATNATIGGVIGAVIGGLGGYTWGSADLDHLSEEQKFKKRLKNALLYSAVGALGGSGLGYGGTVLADQLNQKREKTTAEKIIDKYIEAPFGTGAVIGGAGGAGIGAISGALIPPHALQGATQKGAIVRGGVKGALKGVLLGGALDLAKGVAQTVINK